MARATDVPRRTASDANAILPTGSRDLWLDIAFQCSLATFLLGVVWIVVSPEAATSAMNRTQVILVSCGFSLSTGIWATQNPWRIQTKLLTTLMCTSLAVIVAISFIHQFDLNEQIMERGQPVGNRIKHRAIGLSYEIPSGYEVNLVPFISHNNRVSRTSETRLRTGDMAVLCRMEAVPPSGGGLRMPSAIRLEVLSNSMVNSSTLMRGVRQFEAQCAGYPNVRIVESTHTTTIAGHKMFEFTFFDDSQRLAGRHLYFQAGTFTLRFVLVTSEEKSAATNKAFVDSIRLESWQS